MNTQDVLTLFAYNRWANQRLIDAASCLRPEEFTRDLGASFRSMHGTLVHIMWGERRWLQFWQNGTFAPEPALNDFPDCASVATAWALLEADRERFVNALDDERLAVGLSVGDQSYTLAELIQHILNHSTYHRGQLALLLRQLGHAPPATDYRYFLSAIRAPAT